MGARESSQKKKKVKEKIVMEKERGSGSLMSRAEQRRAEGGDE